MPIKGLTDNVRVAFPSIGELRKGAPKGEKGIGADLDHFRFTSNDPGVVADFALLYGTKPQSLQVYLPYAKASANFETWKEAWTASGLAHRCDGETCTRWRDKNGIYSEEPIPCPGGCSPVGRLVLMLPEMFDKGRVGNVTFQTHGKHDLMSITGSLMQAEELMRDNPLGLKGIEWTLYRKKAMISVPRDKGRVRTAKWLVHIVPSTEWVRLQLQMAEASQLLQLPPAQPERSEHLAALIAGNVDPLTGEVLVDIDDEEGEIIEDLPFTEEAEIPPKPQGPPLQAVKNGKVINEAESLQVKILNVINARGLKGETVRKIVGMVTNKEQAVDEVTNTKHLTAILKEFESD